MRGLHNIRHRRVKSDDGGSGLLGVLVLGVIVSILGTGAAYYYTEMPLLESGVIGASVGSLFAILIWFVLRVAGQSPGTHI
jgi:NhaP-type Na+/H+ and K+/H+ antiporter